MFWPGAGREGLELRYRGYVFLAGNSEHSAYCKIIGGLKFLEGEEEGGGSCLSFCIRFLFCSWILLACLISLLPRVLLFLHLWLLGRGGRSGDFFLPFFHKKKSSYLNCWGFLPGDELYTRRQKLPSNMPCLSGWGIFGRMGGEYLALLDHVGWGLGWVGAEISIARLVGMPHE